ncbi:hypothetical protein BDZ97DRAFT_194411 [Flammula alnicola]|nr:hypothetical protein BDZ97DRAFT_194411 [Flammula alnicola]
MSLYFGLDLYLLNLSRCLSRAIHYQDSLFCRCQSSIIIVVPMPVPSCRQFRCLNCSICFPSLLWSLYIFVFSVRIFFVLSLHYTTRTYNTTSSPSLNVPCFCFIFSPLSLFSFRPFNSKLNWSLLSSSLFNMHIQYLVCRPPYCIFIALSMLESFTWHNTYPLRAPIPSHATHLHAHTLTRIHLPANYRLSRS